MNPEQEQPSVRRIVLPSGRSIEVVRFGDNDQATHRGLHVCPDCNCELVQPLDWSEAPDESWNLVLACPNCDWYTAGLYTQEQVRELEDRLDDGLSDMLRDLQRLTRANMVDQIDRFIAALNADQILPEDF
jgi:hypothetical protein